MRALVPLLVACCAVAQSRTSPDTSWLPLHVGALWEYVSDAGMPVTVDCVARENERGCTRFICERRDGATLARERWTIGRYWIEREVQTPGRALLTCEWGSPEQFLALPVGISAAWGWREMRPDGDGETPIPHRAELVAMRETIEVPAGRFACLCVVIDERTRIWMARGVGIVKLVEAKGHGHGMPQTLSLKRYTPLDSPPDADLAAEVARALTSDPRGAPLRIAQVRTRGIREALTSRFCRVWWKDTTMLCREQAGRVVAFDPLDAGQWNALAAAEGIVLDPKAGQRTSSLSVRRLALAAGLLRASEACATASDAAAGLEWTMPFDRTWIVASISSQEEVGIRGETREGRPFMTTMRMTVADGKIVRVEQR